MSLSLLISAIIEGLAYASLIYLIAAGLVFIFGLMDILNFAQSAFFMLGTFLVIHILLTFTSNFITATILTTLIGFLLGISIERVLLRRLYGNPASQMLITLGIMMVIIQFTIAIWPMGLVFPLTDPIFSSTVSIMGIHIYVYRFVVIGIGFTLFAIIHIILRRTLIGAKLRAGIENRELAETFGVNIKRTFTLVFGMATAITFFGGAVASPWLNASVEIGLSFTLLAFAVIILGGMKSHTGVFIASLVMGLIHQICAYFLPALVFIVDVLVMIVVLATRPEGLFGAMSR